VPVKQCGGSCSYFILASTVMWCVSFVHSSPLYGYTVSSAMQCVPVQKWKCRISWLLDLLPFLFSFSFFLAESVTFCVYYLLSISQGCSFLLSRSNLLALASCKPWGLEVELSDSMFVPCIPPPPLPLCPPNPHMKNLHRCIHLRISLPWSLLRI
jgi:hypothetical protein